ncbi:MAG: hypothetical protein EOP84_32260 [Verrucomicrobiaceae bacterium]|nr:MAG: hypothetical protein EOP84_32260 [Verrucomicrobiaceae bacterium]
MTRIAKFIAAWLITSCIAQAVMIGDFPGLSKLAEQADAIVVLRIDKSSDDFGSPDHYSTHECYIYQTIKGDIPKGGRVRLRLMDTRHPGISVFGSGTTFLAFLTKKRSSHEPTEYRSLEIRGSITRLPPTGQESAPVSLSPEDHIRRILKRAVEVNTQEHQQEEQFLRKMIGDHQDDR